MSTVAARKHVHTEVLPIRWGDMDAMGHVNNTVYFRYMEQARIGLYERVGLGQGGPHLPPDCGPVVIDSSCTFRRALTYPGNVEVRVYVGEVGRASIMTYYELRPSYDPSVVYADGAAKACFIDMKKNKSIALPAPLRALAPDHSHP